MPGSAAKVIITERQQAVLRQLKVSQTAARRLTQRAHVILLAFEGWRNEDVATEAGLNRQAVGDWRRRWARRFDALVQVECTESHAELRRAIEATLADEHRSGAHGKFTAEQVTQILALACEPPEQSERPITHWTARELADEAKKRGIVPSISATQVGRYLRDAALQPHRSRYWLNTKEKDPERFQQQVEAVCDTYREAPRLAREENRHTICVDEMTGIQALERIAPTLPMRPGQVESREFEYRRHGTQTLIGNFDVVSGKMVSPTIQATRTETDFVAHVTQTVAADPGGSWVIVVDNLNIHCSEGLVKFVAASCGLEQDLGKKRQSGRPEIARKPADVFVRPQAPDPLRVCAEAHLVAEPNRGRLRRGDAQGRPPRQLLLRRRSARQAAALP